MIVQSTITSGWMFAAAVARFEYLNDNACLSVVNSNTNFLLSSEMFTRRGGSGEGIVVSVILSLNICIMFARSTGATRAIPFCFIMAVLKGAVDSFFFLPCVFSGKFLPALVAQSIPDGLKQTGSESKCPEKMYEGAECTSASFPSKDSSI